MKKTFYISLLVLSAVFSSILAEAQSSGFIENKGQWNAAVTHKLRVNGGDFWLERGGWSLSLMNSQQRESALHAIHDDSETSSLVDGHIIKVRLLRSNARPIVRSLHQKPEYHNYFIGNDSASWKGHVGLFDKVIHERIYPGIDMHVSAINDQPKITYVVQPNVSPHSIGLVYEGHRGLSTNGERLVITTSIGDIVEEDLYAYQTIDGQSVEVKCRFIVDGDEVGFKVGRYDESVTLFIDPTVIASTNSGCTSEAFGHTATFNDAGQIYSGGRCFGTGYPTDTGAFQVDFGGPYTGSYYLKVDMCLSKYNSDGSSLIYATYLGGNAEDLPHSMIVNDSDHVVLLGSTNSTNYPVSGNAHDTTHNGGKDIVITSFSSDGSQLIGSTYLGGSSSDGVNNLEQYYADAYRGEVVLDSFGNIYIASFTRSGNFPATNVVFQDSLAGQQDGVVCKLSSALDTLFWATYLGGSARDAAFALKVDDSSNVYVAGVSASSNFPVDSNAAYASFIGGSKDAFVVKLNPSGQTMLAGSFFGTTSADQNYFVELDPDGGVYLFGTSGGAISATTGKYVGPGSGGYVYKTNWNLDTVEWVSTFGNLAPAAFLVDNCSRIYISGQGATASVLNLGSFDTLDPVNSLTQAGFYLMKLSPDASDIEFGSFYGNNGSHVDGGTSRFDKRGVVYQATCSNGTFPTTSWAYSTTNQTNNATYDNTVFKIDFESNVAKAEIVPGDTACAPYLAIFDNDGSVGNVHFWDFGDGTTSTDSMPTHLYDSVGFYDIFYVVTDSAGCYGDDTAHMTLNVLSAVVPTILIGDTDCVDSVLLSVDTTDFSGFQWSTGQSTSEIYIYNEGTYSVTTTANLFCENSESVDITFQEAYHFQLNDTGICEVGFPVFGPSSALWYAWSTGDSTQSTIISTTGEYTLTASNGDCEQVESMNVDVSFVRFTAQDTALCLDSFPLTVGHPGGSVLWSTNQTSATISVWQTGTYWVTVSNGFCISSDTIEIEFDPELVNLGLDTTVCDGFELTVSGDYDAYLWSNGTTGNSVYIDSTTSISLKVGSGNCTDTDTLRVNVEHLKFEEQSLNVCDLDSFQVFAPDFAKADYYWSTGDTLLTAWVFETGNYWVNIKTEYCQNRDTAAVRFVTTPPFSLGPDTSMCFGETLTIPIDSNYSQPVWSTGDTGASITLRTAGEFWAGQYYQGCIRYDTIFIGLRELMSDSFSMINNVMTPNGDGLNDVLEFHIEEESLVLDYHLWVFDRWGIQVFESEDMHETWNGIRPSGRAADDGAFFYILELETTCTQRPIIEVKDNATLLR